MRLAAEHPGGRAGQDGGRTRVVQVQLAAAVGGEQREPGARGRPSSTAAASRSRASGRWKTLPVDARTALPLCGSTVSPASRTAPAPAASATRITVPALPGSRDADQHRDEGGRPGERDPDGHVEEVADGDEALRGDGVRERLRGPVGDR